MKIGIHQPNFSPWVGYFDKIARSDKFVFLDTVKCSKNSYFNRNRFSTSRKMKDFFWMTCPLTRDSYSKNINEVVFKTSSLKKHVKHYNMRHAKTVEPDFLKSILEVYDDFIARENDLLSNFNIEIIKKVCNYIEIDTELILSSDIVHDNSFQKQELLEDIILQSSCNIYVSGNGAKDYQDEEGFKNKGIGLEYTAGHYPKAKTILGEHISVVDLILEEGGWAVRKMISL